MSYGVLDSTPRKARTIRVCLYVGPTIVREVALRVGLCCPQASDIIEGTEHVIWTQVEPEAGWGSIGILRQVAEQTGLPFLQYERTLSSVQARVIEE